MDIEKDRPVFLRVFDPPLYLVGLGIALEVDHVATVFLQCEDFFDGSVVPLCRLQRTFGAALTDPLAGAVGRGVQNPCLTERRCNLHRAVALQSQTVDAPYYLGGLRVNHPKLGIARVFDISVRRRGQRDAGIAFHFVDDPALLGNVFGVPLIHNVAERGEIILALVAVNAIGNSNQPNVVLREKFLGELADFNVVAAQPGKVFDKHCRNVPGLDCLYHFLKTGAFHRRACNSIIHEKDGVRVAFFLGYLLQDLFQILDAVGLVVHVIVTAQTAVEGGCAGCVFT